MTEKELTITELEKRINENLEKIHEQNQKAIEVRNEYCQMGIHSKSSNDIRLSLAIAKSLMDENKVLSTMLFAKRLNESEQNEDEDLYHIISKAYRNVYDVVYKIIREHQTVKGIAHEEIVQKALEKGAELEKVQRAISELTNSGAIIKTSYEPDVRYRTAK